MSRFIQRSLVLVTFAIGAAASTAHAGQILLPTSPLTVDAISTTGSSFTVTGTVNATDTMSLDVTGLAFLQSNPSAYGANAAGVVVQAGQFPGEGVGTATPCCGAGTPDFGALTLTIAGLGPVQIFPADIANGLGSASPPEDLSFNGTLGSLFGAFSPLTNPVFTLTVADAPGQYSDNSGAFTVTNVLPVSVPEPSTIFSLTVGLLLVAGMAWRRHQS